MSRLTFKLIATPTARLNLSKLTPHALAGHTQADIERLILSDGKSPVRVGDVFNITGPVTNDIHFAGGSHLLDDVGAGMTSGTVTVEGAVGTGAGRGMKGGRLDIKAAADDHLASGMSGGIITVGGSAGASVGAVAVGARFGMTGGTVVIAGDCGDRAGDKMRRGIIIVRGKTGDAAGSRMIGGTIVAEGGFGTNPGRLMRRGTLIGPGTDRMLATFADCGVHDLVILRVMQRALAHDLHALAPRNLPSRVRRFAGDMAAIGKGELLITTI